MLKCGNNSLRCGAMVALLFLLISGMGETASLCPDGWDVYSQDTPYTCYWESQYSVSSLSSAQSTCRNKNASLLITGTDKKYQHFKGMVNGSSTRYWFPLKFYGNEPYWITNDGIEKVTLRPGLSFSRYDINGNYHPDYRTNQKGFLYKSGALYSPASRNYYSYKNNAEFVCEMPFSCKSGYFGEDCDQECHCHGKMCDPTDSKGLCLFGCQVGWMGPSCSQKKEDAKVTYFCVNSADQGIYAHIMIAAKGVHYDNINAVTEDQKNIPWCNDTEITRNKEIDMESIKIYITSSTTDGIKAGKCAGKISQNGHYEWMIQIQEKEGLVSRNDQMVHVECDFSDADTFTMSGISDIKREKWFRRADIRRPIEYLEETKEILDLQVVDPFSGAPVTSNLIGSPVVLKIRYAMAEGNFATNVLPYNCDATTPEGNKTSRLLDMNGCPLEGSPVSEFFSNGSKSLITKPFPLFGFDGNKNIEFHCSYILCFGNDSSCSRDCRHVRHRRSPRMTEYRLSGSVEIIPNFDKPVLNEEETKYLSAGRGLSKLDYIFLLSATFIAAAFK